MVLSSLMLKGSVYGSIKLTVFVCQNLMVFTQPCTNLPEMLPLSPYHTASGAIVRSLIAQWYNKTHSELLVGGDHQFSFLLSVLLHSGQLWLLDLGTIVP